MIDARDRFGADGDAVARQPIAVRPVEAAAVGADRDVAAPGFQPEREPGDVRAAAEGGERPIAALPVIAIGAVEDRTAVTLVEAGNRRQIVDYAGRDQQIACVLRAA